MSCRRYISLQHGMQFGISPWLSICAFTEPIVYLYISGSAIPKTKDGAIGGVSPVRCYEQVCYLSCITTGSYPR
jgi:hypothetical protein